MIDTSQYTTAKTSCCDDTLNDQSFLRYSNHILLEEIGIEGQQRLKATTVLIAGLGGLGSPAALYLAAAGVGTLLLADDDTLHITNLHRQVIYHTNDIGLSKAILAQKKLTQLNSDCVYLPITRRINDSWIDEQISHVDLVLDCSDNMITRHIINSACVRNDVPLISGSATGFKGQLLLVHPPWLNGCYACLFPEQDEIQLNCHNAGVLGPVVGIMGVLQALEAIKFLTKTNKRDNFERLLLFDGKNLKWHTLVLRRDPECQICSNK